MGAVKVRCKECGYTFTSEISPEGTVRCTNCGKRSRVKVKTNAQKKVEDEELDRKVSEEREKLEERAKQKKASQGNPAVVKKASQGTTTAAKGATKAKMEDNDLEEAPLQIKNQTAKGKASSNGSSVPSVKNGTTQNQKAKGKLIIDEDDDEEIDNIGNLAVNTVQVANNTPQRKGTESNLEERYMYLTIWDYIKATLIGLIPLAGGVLIILGALGIIFKKKEGYKHFFRANLLIAAATTLLMVAFSSVITGILMNMMLQ
jgi:DNA-directed RNA polymerase subunit RPC12/RpoP